MIGAEELGEDMNKDSGSNSGNLTSSTDDFDSDYEEFRRKKKQRARRKKEEQRKKRPGKKTTDEKDRQKYQGTEEEVAGMIRKLNAMRLDDPEYAPIYYKVMTMDQTGAAKQCVKQPSFGRTTRIAAANGPRVMLGAYEDEFDCGEAVSFFYQQQQSNKPEDEAGSEEEQAEASTEDEIYLTIPRREVLSMVQAAERSVPGIRKNRKEVFDGVNPGPPVRDSPRGRAVRDLMENEVEVENKTPTSSPAQVTLPKKGLPGSLKKAQPSKALAKEGLPELTPIEARKVRFDISEDEEMPDVKPKGATSQKIERKKGEERRMETGISGRQSELTSTIDKQAVIDRILDSKVELSLREIMVTSKDLRTEIQDVIKVKNVKAVLLGSTMQHPIITNLSWPRRDGILIKIEMETGGQPRNVLEYALMNSNTSYVGLTPDTESPPGVPPRAPFAPLRMEPYEHVQYLSRQQYEHPPLVSLAQPPSPEDALVAIEGVLHEQWGKYHRRQPIDVRPTFSAAPQSVYVGSYSEPNGQLVHRSIAMNNLEVLTDSQTGLPYTITGHTVIRPTSVFIRKWTAACEPPLETMATRVFQSTLRSNALPVSWNTLEIIPGKTPQPPYSDATQDKFVRRFRLDECTTVAPADTIAATQDGSPPLPYSGSDSGSTNSSMPILEPIPKKFTHLNENIAERLTKDLHMEGEFGFVSLNEDIGPRLKELLDSCDRGLMAEHGSGTSIADSIGIWGGPVLTPPYMIPGHPPTIAETVSSEDSQKQQEFLDHAVRQALAPFLDEVVNLPSTEEEGWMQLASTAHEARSAFEKLESIFEAKRLKKERRLAVQDNAETENAARAPFQDPDSLIGARAPELSAADLAAAQALASLTTNASANVSRDPRPREAKYSSLANALVPPDLSRVTAQPITRDVWSSSSEPVSSEYSYEEIDPYGRYPRQPAVNSKGNFSSAVSEWSVTSSDFAIEPENILNEALFRVRVQQEDTSNMFRSTSAPPTPTLRSPNHASPPVTATSANTTSFTGTAAYDTAEMGGTMGTSFFDGLHEPESFGGPQNRCAQLPPGCADDLCEWAEDGMRHRNEFLHWEDGIHGEPLRDALRTLHGPLARFLDYPTMAREGVASLSAFSPLVVHCRDDSHVSPSPPDPTQSPTSLDFSLPTDPRPETEEPGNDEMRDNRFKREPLHHGQKREPPSPEDAQLETRKLRKFPSGLADPDVVRLYKSI
ncbi:hypothetical protein C8R47DRAFT_1222767 [Mycena vitilis]|nr:hypothetical protein C8R47DRAFT_1222767 [Mycena vitilis]